MGLLENGCNIKVLGGGCKSCHELHENVQKAVANMNLDAEVEYITDMEKVRGTAAACGNCPGDCSKAAGDSCRRTDGESGFCLQ